jgi:hypothetical protein
MKELVEQNLDASNKQVRAKWLECPAVAVCMYAALLCLIERRRL